MPSAASTRPSLVRSVHPSVVREVLEAHARYLKGVPNGRRAGLQYVNLSH